MKASNFNPIWYEKTKDGEMMTDVYSRLVKDRILFVTGEITQETASTVVAMLLLLDSQDDSKEIELWINSDGGAVDGFFAIYDVMQTIKAPVRTVCFGTASSAAAMLLASGAPGLRFCMPNARIMIHEIQIGSIGGTGTEVDISAKETKIVNTKVKEVLARHTGNALSKIKRDTSYDKYFDAVDAKAYGLVDKIISFNKKIPELKRKGNDKSTSTGTVENNSES